MSRSNFFTERKEIQQQTREQLRSQVQYCIYRSVTPHHVPLFFFCPLRTDTMSALGGTEFKMPKAKEAVTLCMDVREFKNPMGCTMYEVSCPQCIAKNSADPKSWTIPATQGLGNPWVHFRRCVDDDAALEQMITEARRVVNENKRIAAKERGDPPPPPSGQSNVAGFCHFNPLILLLQARLLLAPHLSCPTRSSL